MPVDPRLSQLTQSFLKARRQARVQGASDTLGRALDMFHGASAADTSAKYKALHQRGMDPTKKAEIRAGLVAKLADLERAKQEAATASGAAKAKAAYDVYKLQLEAAVDVTQAIVGASASTANARVNGVTETARAGIRVIEDQTRLPELSDRDIEAARAIGRNLAPSFGSIQQSGGSPSTTDILNTQDLAEMLSLTGSANPGDGRTASTVAEIAAGAGMSDRDFRAQLRVVAENSPVAAQILSNLDKDEVTITNLYETRAERIRQLTDLTNQEIEKKGGTAGASTFTRAFEAVTKSGDGADVGQRIDAMFGGGDSQGEGNDPSLAQEQLLKMLEQLDSEDTREPVVIARERLMTSPEFKTFMKDNNYVPGQERIALSDLRVRVNRDVRAARAEGRGQRRENLAADRLARKGGGEAQQASAGAARGASERKPGQQPRRPTDVQFQGPEDIQFKPPTAADVEQPEDIRFQNASDVQFEQPPAVARQAARTARGARGIDWASLADATEMDRINWAPVEDPNSQAAIEAARAEQDAIVREVQAMMAGRLKAPTNTMPYHLGQDPSMSPEQQQMAADAMQGVMMDNVTARDMPIQAPAEDQRLAIQQNVQDVMRRRAAAYLGRR